MNVLVAYASRHGSTAGIAERVAAGLRAVGLDADARPVGEVGGLAVITVAQPSRPTAGGT